MDPLMSTIEHIYREIAAISFKKGILFVSVMGRVKSRFVKSSAEKILVKTKDEITTDFQKNKEIVSRYAEIPSKKMRNSVVGYVTRLKKRNKEE